MIAPAIHTVKYSKCMWACCCYGWCAFFFPIHIVLCLLVWFYRCCFSSGAFAHNMIEIQMNWIAATMLLSGSDMCVYIYDFTQFCDLCHKKNTRFPFHTIYIIRTKMYWLRLKYSTLTFQFSLFFSFWYRTKKFLQSFSFIKKTWTN